MENAIPLFRLGGEMVGGGGGAVEGGGKLVVSFGLGLGATALAAQPALGGRSTVMVVRREGRSLKTGYLIE